MNNILKLISGILALVLIFGGAYFLYSKLSEQYAPDMLSIDYESDGAVDAEVHPAPDFTVIDSSANEVKLSQMEGRPVVVNFWASWCPPCKNELPYFEKAYKKYGDDISFMMVNMTDGQQETLEKAKAHIEQNRYTFPVYFDTEYSAATAYRVESLPTTYFVDADGNIVIYARGMLNYKSLEEGIKMIQS